MVVNNKIAIFTMLIGILFFCPSEVYSQTNNTTEVPLTLSIPPVSLINFAVDDDQVVTYSFSLLEPNNVEQIITPGTKDKTWLNYSSIVSEGSTNYITVSISSGSLPPEVSLRVLISEDIGFGTGSLGTTIGEITLSSYPQNIIVNIGSCYTGIGLRKGHRLTYIWDSPDGYHYEYGQNIAVTYTINSTE